MSRIGQKPVTIPSGVKFAVQGREVSVEGPLGKLQLEHRPEVQVRYDQKAQKAVVSRDSENRTARAYHGMTRALIQNMVLGVSQGFEKRLQVVGVGYLAAVDAKTRQLQLRLGFANEVHMAIPEGLEVTCPDQTHVVIKGCDKQQVGQFAADVRAIRKPEPYKGKGVRYEGEHVRIKPGKTAT
jgi:large subunit ribosomal protein L6